jgi:hypothetical protein
MEPRDILDDELRRSISKWARFRIFLTGAVSVILIIISFVGYTLIQSNHSRIQASCHAWRIIGSAPVSASPATHRPTELAVSLVAASREAFYGQNCPGHLPSADQSVTKWARYYHINVE